MSTTITAQLVPVYKFYSTDPWRFFYSTKRDDAAIRAGWTRAEKIAFHAYNAPTAFTVPVYRFVATAPYRYQYSTNPTPSGPGWKNEGAAFYAFPINSLHRPSGVAVLQYHAVSADGGWRYQYVVNSTDPGLQGWIKDGIAFYAPAEPGC